MLPLRSPIGCGGATAGFEGRWGGLSLGPQRDNIYKADLMEEVAN